MVGESGGRNTGTASSYNDLGERFCARFYLGRGKQKMRIKEVIVIKKNSALYAQIYATCDDMQGGMDIKLQLVYKRVNGRYVSPISDWELCNIPEKDLPEIIQDDFLSCPNLGKVLRDPFRLRKEIDELHCPKLQRRLVGGNFELTVEQTVDALKFSQAAGSNTPVYIMNNYASTW